MEMNIVIGIITALMLVALFDLFFGKGDGNEY